MTCVGMTIPKRLQANCLTKLRRTFMAEIQIRNLGLISYDNAMSVMEDLHSERCQNRIPDTILVLEHFPVITKGRRLQDQKIPREDEIAASGIQIRQADRGGLLTYHGPGQIVVYFILRLDEYFDGISTMVALIESTLKDFFSTQRVVAETVADHPGIWVQGRKIASLGLRVASGVTKHGISVNFSNDLSAYSLFDPCGLSGTTMTNLENVTGRKLTLKDLRQLEWSLVHDFQHRLHDRRIQQKLIA
jgi:lipoate-protein ligase B